MSKRYSRRWLLLLTLLLTVVAVLPLGQKAQGPSTPKQTKPYHPNAVPGEILVRFRPQAKAEQSGRQIVTERTGRQIPMTVEPISPAYEILEGLRLAKVNPADTSNAIEALRARPDVLYAEPNYIRRALVAPNDPRYPELWGLHNIGQRATFGGNPGFAGNDIRAEQAWAITTGSRNVVVGVIDTGIDINHQDLHDNIWTNPGEVPGNNVDDDGNGFVDDIHGWDFAHNDASVFDYTEPTFPPSNNYTGDLDFHGTHVAGTIGATGNNGIGVAGVNWQVSLMSLKFLTDDGAGSTTDLLNAYSYAKAMKLLWDSSGGTKGANIRVLNNSYGGDLFSQSEQDAIRALSDAGILFVVSAGNEGVTNDLFPAYPSNYISPNLISVAASGGTGTKADFSNFGEGTVNVSAPGEYILSTTPKNTYNFLSGTSMAAPHVSGTAALVCALSPNITMQKLHSLMMYSGYFGNAFLTSTRLTVDADKALQTTSSADVTPPGAIAELTANISDTFPNYSLSWLATGDDGNVGKVTAYEVRFSESSLNESNFDLGTPLPGPTPADPGFTHFVNVKVPWRHSSGFIGVRGVDEAGNKGPIAQVPISVGVDVGDPYIMSETAAAPLSTGGTALQLVGDDQLKPVALPFSFKFYGIDYTSVTVSTNGVVYFGFSSDNDRFVSPRWLNGRRLVAGLWDDLRTDHRTDGDVYMVQDIDRVIFRWQAVTFDLPLGPGVTRGENPVNFEIELRYDGTITIRYGDGNQKLIPVVGIGGGSPEPYLTTSHTASDGLKDLTNAATVVFTRRAPVKRGVLTVASSNPTSGVNITISANDISGASNGTTQFTRTYNPGTPVTLTAPDTFNGNKFKTWQLDGQDVLPGPITFLTVAGNSNHTMTAVYASKPVLTVTSTNPSSGVNITVTPNDVNGAGNGTTPFTRTYDQFAGVNLTAPITVGNSTFWKWQVDGADFVPSQLATISMNIDHTAKAIYVEATATPTPTPVPGAGAQPIAFVKPGTSGSADIFLVNTDGTNVVNLTDRAGDDTRPAWSPDGTRLAYTCLRQPDGSVGPPERICLRNADGTGFTVLSVSLADDFFPAWSHDGSQIVFMSSFNGSPSTIVFTNVDGGGRFPIALFAAGDPDFSPDDKTLVYVSDNSIWTFNRITGGTLRLTNQTADFRPHYSPDGTKIVFHSFRDGQTEIYVMNADGSAQTRLTNNPALDSAPAWSPDGTKILFTSTRDDPMSQSLYVMNADGSNQTRVTTGSNGVWRTPPGPPIIYAEEGTTNAAALSAITYLRSPFKIIDPFNFSIDGHTRITLFTSNLAVVSPPVPAASTLSVQANGINLPVETVGPITGVNGLAGSYIIVKLPDGLPGGNLSLTVTLRGQTSAPRILPIAP